MNLKAIQMGSNPKAKLNHHMKSYDLAPCEVTRSSDKVKLHDVLEIAHGLLQLSPTHTGSRPDI